MKKYLFIIGITAAMFAACSGSEELVTQDVTEPIDEENVTRQDLMGDIPIEFATIDGIASVELTRGSASINNVFSSGPMGIYCVAAKKLNQAADDIKVTGSATALGNILTVWLDNVSAHVVPVGNNNGGYIAWDNPNEKHYYPNKDWYAYKFAAYHPWTKYTIKSSSTNGIAAYIPIDGNDDVFTAIAQDPRAIVNPETDAKAYSHDYFKAIGSGSITAEHRPYYSFKHLTSRLRFKVRLKEDCERELHVDSICFSDFPNIMRVSLAKYDGSDIINNWNANHFVTNYSEYMPPALKDSLPKKRITVNSQPVDACIVNGHFWLREADDTSIGAKVNGNYKYVVSTAAFQDDGNFVGDCIMMPPVFKDHTKSTIKLEVYLADNYGNKYTTIEPIKLEAPAIDPNDPNDKGGWKPGSSYTVKVSLGGNIFFMDQTRSNNQLTGDAECVLEGYVEDTTHEYEVSD